MDKVEKVSECPRSSLCLSINESGKGGKAKPLKAAKKEKKELDEDDLAFQAKQRAGSSNLLARRMSTLFHRLLRGGAGLNVDC